MTLRCRFYILDKVGYIKTSTDESHLVKETDRAVDKGSKSESEAYLRIDDEYFIAFLGDADERVDDVCA